MYFTLIAAAAAAAPAARTLPSQPRWARRAPECRDFTVGLPGDPEFFCGNVFNSIPDECVSLSETGTADQLLSCISRGNAFSQSLLIGICECAACGAVETLQLSWAYLDICGLPKPIVCDPFFGEGCVPA